jgi:hypothetical protein
MTAPDLAARAKEMETWIRAHDLTMVGAVQLRTRRGAREVEGLTCPTP